MRQNVCKPLFMPADVQLIETCLRNIGAVDGHMFGCNKLGVSSPKDSTSHDIISSESPVCKLVVVFFTFLINQTIIWLFLVYYQI